MKENQTCAPATSCAPVFEYNLGCVDCAWQLFLHKSSLSRKQVAIHYYGRLVAKQGWRFDSIYDHKDENGDPMSLSSGVARLKFLLQLFVSSHLLKHLWAQQSMNGRLVGLWHLPAMILNLQKCPRQPNDTDCGYYVMHFMKEIILQSQVKIPIAYFPDYKCFTYSTTI